MVNPEFQSPIAIIPARGGSKGIPGKNIKPFCGKPLIAWTIEQLQAAGVGTVFVSTDSSEISSVARRFGAEVINRPDALSRDDSSSEAALLHALEIIGPPDNLPILFAQATSPLRPVHAIVEALSFFRDFGCDSLFSAVQIDDLTVWKGKEAELLPYIGAESGGRIGRQFRESTYVETGSFYIFTQGSFRESHSRVSGNIIPFLMPPWTIHELDSPEDWSWAEKMMGALMPESETEND